MRTLSYSVLSFDFCTRGIVVRELRFVEFVFFEKRPAALSV